MCWNSVSAIVSLAHCAKPWDSLSCMCRQFSIVVALHCLLSSRVVRCCLALSVTHFVTDTWVFCPNSCLVPTMLVFSFAQTLPGDVEDSDNLLCRSRLSIGSNLIVTNRNMRALSGCVLDGTDATSVGSKGPADGERNAVVSFVGLPDGSAGSEMVLVEDTTNINTQFIVDCSYVAHRMHLPFVFTVRRVNATLSGRPLWTSFVLFRNGPLPHESVITIVSSTFGATVISPDVFAFSVLDFAVDAMGDGSRIWMVDNSFALSPTSVTTRELSVSGVSLFASTVVETGNVYNVTNRNTNGAAQSVYSAVISFRNVSMDIRRNQMVIPHWIGVGRAQCHAAFFISHASAMLVTNGSQILFVNNLAEVVNGRVPSNYFSYDTFSIFRSSRNFSADEGAIVADIGSTVRTTNVPRVASFLVSSNFSVSGLGTGVFVREFNLTYAVVSSVRCDLPFASGWAFVDGDHGSIAQGAVVVVHGMRVLTQLALIPLVSGGVTVVSFAALCRINDFVVDGGSALSSFFGLSSVQIHVRDSTAHGESLPPLFSYSLAKSGLFVDKSSAFIEGIGGMSAIAVGFLYFFTANFAVRGSFSEVGMQSNYGEMAVDASDAAYMGVFIIKEGTSLLLADGGAMTASNETVYGRNITSQTGFCNILASDEQSSVRIDGGALRISDSVVDMYAYPTWRAPDVSSFLAFIVCFNWTTLAMDNGGTLWIVRNTMRAHSPHRGAGVSVFGIQSTDVFNMTSSSLISVHDNNCAAYVSGDMGQLYFVFAARDVLMTQMTGRSRIHVQRNVLSIRRYSATSAAALAMGTAGFGAVIDMTQSHKYLVHVLTGSTMRFEDNTVQTDLVLSVLAGLWVEAAAFTVHDGRDYTALVVVRNHLVGSIAYPMLSSRLGYMLSIDDGDITAAAVGSGSKVFIEMCANSRNGAVQLAAAANSANIYVSPRLVGGGPRGSLLEACGATYSSTFAATASHSGPLSRTVFGPPLASHSSTPFAPPMAHSHTSSATDAYTHRTVTVQRSLSRTILRGCPTHCRNATIDPHPSPFGAGAAMDASSSSSSSSSSPSSSVAARVAPCAGVAVDDALGAVFVDASGAVPYADWANSSSAGRGGSERGGDEPTSPLTTLASVTVMWEGAWYPRTLVMIGAWRAGVGNSSGGDASPPLDDGSVVLLGFERVMPAALPPSSASSLPSGGVRLHLALSYATEARRYHDTIVVQFGVGFDCIEHASVPQGGLTLGLALNPMPPPTPVLSRPVGDAAAVTAIAGGILGGASGAADVQTMALLGLSACAEGVARTKEGLALRSLSPLATSEDCEGALYGNVILAAGIALLQLAAVMIVWRCAARVPGRGQLPSADRSSLTLGDGGPKDGAGDDGATHHGEGAWRGAPSSLSLWSALDRLKFPSLALTAIVFCQNGFLTCGMSLGRGGADDSSSSPEEGGGTAAPVGAAHVAVVWTIVPLVLFWVIARLMASRAYYPLMYRVDGRGWRHAASVLLPTGRLDTDVLGTRAFGTVISKCRFHSPWWPLVSFFSFIASAPIVLGSGRACMPLYGLSAVLHFVFAGVILALQPYTVRIRSFSHPLSLVLNGILVIHYLILLSDDDGSDPPEGFSASLNFFATLQTVVSILTTAHTVFLQVFPLIAERYAPQCVPFAVSCSWEVARWPHGGRGVTLFTELEADGEVMDAFKQTLIQPAHHQHQHRSHHRGDASVAARHHRPYSNPMDAQVPYHHDPFAADGDNYDDDFELDLIPSASDDRRLTADDTHMALLLGGGRGESMAEDLHLEDEAAAQQDYCDFYADGDAGSIEVDSVGSVPYQPSSSSLPHSPPPWGGRGRGEGVLRLLSLREDTVR